MPILPIETRSASHCSVRQTTLQEQLPASEPCGTLSRILVPGGVLYLSWRVGDGSDSRDATGRLYSAFCVHAVRAALASFTLLYDQEELSTASGKRMHRLIARKPAE